MWSDVVHDLCNDLQAKRLHRLAVGSMVAPLYSEVESRYCLVETSHPM